MDYLTSMEMIPKEAKKPEDPRRIKKQGEQVNE